jgi:hypothetical protein
VILADVVEVVRHRAAHVELGRRNSSISTGTNWSGIRFS